MGLPSILVLMLFIHVLRCRLRLLRFSMCLQSYSWRISLQRHRLEHNMISYSLNSVLWIHHEFEGGVRCILYLPHLLGGFLHIYIMYMYYICGLWPPDNVSCSSSNTVKHRVKKNTVKHSSNHKTATPTSLSNFPRLLNENIWYSYKSNNRGRERR
jgi:hypothetical protein